MPKLERVSQHDDGQLAMRHELSRFLVKKLVDSLRQLSSSSHQWYATLAQTRNS